MLGLHPLSNISEAHLLANAQEGAPVPWSA